MKDSVRHAGTGKGAVEVLGGGEGRGKVGVPGRLPGRRGTLRQLRTKLKVKKGRKVNPGRVGRTGKQHAVVRGVQTNQSPAGEMKKGAGEGGQGCRGKIYGDRGKQHK